MKRPCVMGHLASNLLRLSPWVGMRHRDEAVIDLMRETLWCMAWSRDLALVELDDMQREIYRWRRIWPVEEARAILAFRAQQMSNRILELSGLPEPKDPV